MVEKEKKVTKSVTITTRMPTDIHERLRAAADKGETSPTKIINALLDRVLPRSAGPSPVTAEKIVDDMLAESKA